jgi:hypothetical protein
MKDSGIFYGHLVYYTAISYILWPLWYTYFVVILLYFSSFGMLYHEKSGNSRATFLSKL